MRVWSLSREDPLEEGMATHSNILAGRNPMDRGAWSGLSSVQLLSQTLCDPTDCSTPGLPVHHQIPELAQTHVHGVSDAIQPSHPLSSPSPPTFNLSQHQGLFQWLSSSCQVAKILEVHSCRVGHDQKDLEHIDPTYSRGWFGPTRADIAGESKQPCFYLLWDRCIKTNLPKIMGRWLDFAPRASEMGQESTLSTQNAH